MHEYDDMTDRSICRSMVWLFQHNFQSHQDRLVPFSPVGKCRLHAIHCMKFIFPISRDAYPHWPSDIPFLDSTKDLTIVQRICRHGQVTTASKAVIASITPRSGFCTEVIATTSNALPTTRTVNYTWNKIDSPGRVELITCCLSDIFPHIFANIKLNCMLHFKTSLRQHTKARCI